MRGCGLHTLVSEMPEQLEAAQECGMGRDEWWAGQGEWPSGW